MGDVALNEIRISKQEVARSGKANGETHPNHDQNRLLSGGVSMNARSDMVRQNVVDSLGEGLVEAWSDSIDNLQ